MHCHLFQYHGSFTPLRSHLSPSVVRRWISALFFRRLGSALAPVEPKKREMLLLCPSHWSWYNPTVRNLFRIKTSIQLSVSSRCEQAERNISTHGEEIRIKTEQYMAIATIDDDLRRLCVQLGIHNENKVIQLANQQNTQQKQHLVK